jgi:hypothetical protein
MAYSRVGYKYTVDENDLANLEIKIHYLPVEPLIPLLQSQATDAQDRLQTIS